MTEKITNGEKKHKLTEKQQENQTQDKKALKKLLLLLTGSVVVGFAAGVGGGMLGEAINDGDGLQKAWQAAMKLFSVGGAYVYTTALIVLSAVFYKKARTLYAAWEEEDEAGLENIEKKVSYVTWFSQLIMYGSYFFFAVGIWAFELPDLKKQPEQQGEYFWLIFAGVMLHMIYAIVAGSMIQQKAINLTKEINPEKQGSVYDMKFQEKWLDSCDEAERYAAYRCSFKTFKVMQKVGIVLWLICLIGQLTLGTGVFATIMVTVYLLVQTSVYSLYGIHMESKEK